MGYYCPQGQGTVPYTDTHVSTLGDAKVHWWCALADPDLAWAKTVASFANGRSDLEAQFQQSSFSLGSQDKSFITNSNDFFCYHKRSLPGFE